MKAKKMSFFEEEDTKKTDMEPEDEFLDDYVDDDDLYDYERLDRTSGEDGEISVSVNADASEEIRGRDGSL